MIENVVGLKHSYDKQGRRYVDVLGKELKHLGYNSVYDNRPMAQRYIVNAADYGLPENRPRYILKGSKLFTPIYPAPLPKIRVGQVFKKLDNM